MAEVGRPQKIDRQLFHEYLWKTRSHGNRMSFTQGQLSKEFGVTAATMSLIFKEMTEDGRVRRVGSKWVIYDPDLLKWGTQSEQIQADSLF